jgi:hypothetical protein
MKRALTAALLVFGCGHPESVQSKLSVKEMGIGCECWNVRYCRAFLEQAKRKHPEAVAELELSELKQSEQEKYCAQK